MVLELAIEKLRREIYGLCSERKVPEELEADASEVELAAEKEAAKTTAVMRTPEGSRGAGLSRRICRASASYCRGRAHAPAAARRVLISSAKT